MCSEVDNCKQRHCFVVAIDVTGSMGNWAKTVWDKLPMFYGQMNMRGYVTDPAISFAGVGDAYTDRAPLQISEFKTGTHIDEAIEKIWLEGAGGGQTYESYELCAYFYARKCQIRSATTPVFFFMGDEGFYKNIKGAHIEKFIGDAIGEDIPSEVLFRELRNKFHVFFIHKPYFDPEVDAKQLAKWREVVGPERILEMREPKAIVDIMLGAIALIGKTRTLNTYLDDLESRGQSPDRIKEVTRVLQPLSNGLGSPTFGPPGSENLDLDPSEIGLPQPIKPKINVPHQYICPITESIFKVPVLLADGYTYEKEAIVEWLASNNTSPVTEAVLSTKIMFPSTLGPEIEKWKLENNYKD